MEIVHAPFCSRGGEVTLPVDCTLGNVSAKLNTNIPCFKIVIKS